MGSYLSILNNTSDVWSVKIGPDEAAIKFALTTFMVLASAVATAGSAAPAVASLRAAGVATVFGISTRVLGTTIAAAAVVSPWFTYAGTAARGATWMVDTIQSRFSEQGFDRLNPGETKQYGKMTLSLWQQATCIRTRVNPANSEEILVERVFMRPIFSGATANSNVLAPTHDIQFWIDKNGIEHLQTIIRP